MSAKLPDYGRGYRAGYRAGDAKGARRLRRENAALRSALECIAGNHGERSPVTLTEAQEEARDALAFSKEAQP